MKKTILTIILAALCLNFQALAQSTFHIIGRVTDSATNKALSGATVTIKSTKNSVTTDENGSFTFNTKEKQGAFLISFIGYKTIEVNFSNEHPGPFTITLAENYNTLKEVSVVSTGYQTIPKERATGSFAQVDNQLFNRRASTDVLSRLDGVVPGLLFNHNTFNASNGLADISIRGTSTIYGQNQPLIVVDGFPYDGDINHINPNTIESVSVLKDAAAASIWGVKSGNGVIVLTTKHGLRNKKLDIDLNANVTVGNKPNLFYSPNFLNSNDFINFEQALFNKGYYDSDLNSGYLPVSPVIAILARQKAGLISTTDANSQISSLKQNDVRNDITKYFYQRSVNQQYALNLSGGNTNSDYFFSTGYDNNLSNQIGNKNDRVTINTLYNFYPTKNLIITAGINYTQSTSTNNSPLANINGGAGKPGIYPYAQLVDHIGNALPIARDYASAFTDTAGNGKLYDWKYRPLDELQNADNTIKTTDNRINFGLKYNVFKGFNIEARYLYENQKSEANNYFNDQSYYARDLINQFSQFSGSNINYAIPQGGILQESNTELTSQRGRFQLGYNNEWNKKHELSFIAGSEINQTIIEGRSNTAYGYSKDNATYQNVDFVDYFLANPSLNYLQIPNSLGFGKSTDRYISYYSNSAYTYNGRYTVSASGRIDKSNLFGVATNQKSVPLYSAGLSWNLSKESFYNIGWLPYSKFRITYGYNGNIDKNVTAVTTIQQASGAGYTGNPFSVVANPGNPELRWEKERVINLGYDFAFKNAVISGSLEYFFKKGEDLFGDSPLAPSSGLSLFRGNTANIKGNGFDIVLNGNLIRSTGFNWQTDFLLSYALDKVTKYDINQDALSFIILGSGNAGTIYPLTNQPLYAIYSYKWGGLTHDTGAPQGYLNGQLSTDYNSILVNTTTSDMVYNGPSRPTTFGSLRNTFTFKGVSLSLNIVYKFNYYFRRTSVNYGSLAQSWLGNSDFSKRWQKPGDETSTNVPAIQYPPFDGNQGTFYDYSSALVDKGDHIRLQDITFSYDLLSKIGNTKLPFSKLQLYSYINNVAILWRANHDHLDPDLYSTYAYPVPRTYSFGIKASLK